MGENQEEFCRGGVRMSSSQPGGFWIRVEQVENANQARQVIQVGQVKQAQSAGLWDAARRGILHQVKKWLEENRGGNDLNRRVCEYPGGAFVSPLLLATRGGHYAVCQCLLETGARVDRDTMDVAERLGRHHVTKLLSSYLEREKKSPVDRR